MFSVPMEVGVLRCGRPVGRLRVRCRQDFGGVNQIGEDQARS
jgi:hypothetical protein